MGILSAVSRLFAFGKGKAGPASASPPKAAVEPKPVAQVVPPPKPAVEAKPAIQAAPPPKAVAEPRPPQADAARGESLHRYILCDASTIAIDDGKYRCTIGWSNRQELPLAPPAECVFIGFFTATPPGDRNVRLSRIAGVRVDDDYAATAESAQLNERQRELVRQYVGEKIPPYMLGNGGDRALKAFLGAELADKRGPRKRKESRRQTGNEQSIAFACKTCGKTAPGATVDGIAMKRMVGHWCRDCGAMLCRDCQRKAVTASARAAGLAGTTVEHLGKPYAYEDWYGEECQSCDSAFAMEMVNS